MGIKSLVTDFKGLKVMQKRAICLAVLFVVVILGAWGIKAGVDTGYFARVQKLLSNMNMFKAGITLNVPEDEKEELGKSTIGDPSNVGANKGNQAIDTNSVAVTTTKEVPLTRAERIAKMVELAKIADREVKKIAQLEQISEKIAVIASNLQTAQLEATGTDKEAINRMQVNIERIKVQTDATNQQLLLNISQSIAQIQEQVNMLAKQGPSAL